MRAAAGRQLKPASWRVMKLQGWSRRHWLGLVAGVAVQRLQVLVPSEAQQEMSAPSTEERLPPGLSVQARGSEVESASKWKEIELTVPEVGW